MTLAQLLTLLYDRKLPQGYQSISLAVKLGSRVISDSGLSKTDSFKRLRTEKGREDAREHQDAPAGVAGVVTGCPHGPGPLCGLLAVEHYDVLNLCPEGEPMMSCDECGDSVTDESLLETKPIQSPLQVFAGMGGLALIAERLPMLYPDVIQQVRRFCHF